MRSIGQVHALILSTEIVGAVGVGILQWTVCEGIVSALWREEVAWSIGVTNHEVNSSYLFLDINKNRGKVNLHCQYISISPLKVEF